LNFNKWVAHMTASKSKASSSKSSSTSKTGKSLPAKAGASSTKSVGSAKTVSSGKSVPQSKAPVAKAPAAKVSAKPFGAKANPSAGVPQSKVGALASKPGITKPKGAFGKPFASKVDAASAKKIQDGDNKLSSANKGLMSKSSESKGFPSASSSAATTKFSASRAAAMHEVTDPADRDTPKRNLESPLKKKDIEMFTQLLSEEKRKILHHLEEVSASSVQQLDTSAASGDAADIAALEMTQANLQKIGKREAYLLKKIDLAIEKIAAGTYGECEMCGETIAIARLKARPVAQLCIDCKTAQEAEERKFSSRDKSAEGEDEMSEESEEL
jgi:DnaK suppressor protein